MYSEEVLVFESLDTLKKSTHLFRIYIIRIYSEDPLFSHCALFSHPPSGTVFTVFTVVSRVTMLLYFGIVATVHFAASKPPIPFAASHCGRAGPHERVDDEVTLVGVNLDQIFEQEEAFLCRMAAQPATLQGVIEQALVVLGVESGDPALDGR